MLRNGNGQIVKNIHAAKGVIDQICRNLRMKQSIRILENDVKSKRENSPILDFCYNLTNRSTKKTDKPTNIRYFGIPKIPNNFTIEGNDVSDNIVAYHRMVKDSCLYQTKKKVNFRTNNTFAQTKEGNFIQ